MTKDDLACVLRVARQRMMRRVYIAVTILIGGLLPLVFLAATGSITPQAFKIVLCIYSFVATCVTVYVLRRYGKREALCPHCQSTLWHEPIAHQVFASGKCAFCGHNLVVDDLGDTGPGPNTDR